MNKNNGKSSAHHGVDILKYKGFIGTSQYCDSENAFYGKTLNTEKPVIYKGRTPEELYESFCAAVESHLTSLLRVKKQFLFNDLYIDERKAALRTKCGC